ALAVVLAASAAAQTPTPEQLEIFRNLTPEQQQALMEQLAEADPQTDMGSARGSTRQSPVTGAQPAIEAERRRQGSDQQAREIPEVPVIKADDTVLVDARLPEEAFDRPRQPQQARRPIDPAERSRLERLVEQISSRTPYQLDRSGQLILPGLPPIALNGLTERQATQRLSYEPGLLQLEMRLTHLPLERTGIAGLTPFG